MPEFNQGEFNTGEFNGPSGGPSPGPPFNPSSPVITISTPLTPPPQQFTNVNTLINGQYKEAGVLIYRNGLLLTAGNDYTRDRGIVTLLVPPVPGDVLTARVFAIGKVLGGAYPERYIAPWTFRMTGAFNSIATEYHLVFGPTITGVCDGVNRLYQWGVSVPRVQLFKNGLLQTVNVDYAAGANALVFVPGAAPLAGDLLTILAYSA